MDFQTWEEKKKSEENAKRFFALFAIIWLLGAIIGASHIRAGWMGDSLADLKANSDLTLGSNLAFGTIHDFVYGRSYIGLKHSVYRYRKLHLEYGAMNRIYEQRAIVSEVVNHTLGVSIYLKPFLNWAIIPEKYVFVKNLYVGPVTGYNLHRWTAGLQIHIPFSDIKEDNPVSAERAALPDVAAPTTVSRPNRTPMWGNIWGNK